MKKHLFSIIVILVLLGIASAAAKAPSRIEERQIPALADPVYKMAQIELAGERFVAFVSDTEELRSRGLSDFSSLSEGQAMLFAFDEPGNWGFWMKDMDFPIDIVWIGDDMRVVSIAENVSPETFPETFFPDAPAIYAIELPAGTAERIGAREGDAASVSPAR